MGQPRHHHNHNLLTRWTQMLAAPARAWSVFQGVSHLLHMEFFTGLCGSIMPTMIRAPHTVTLTPPAEAVCRLP